MASVVIRVLANQVDAPRSELSTDIALTAKKFFEFPQYLFFHVASPLLLNDFRIIQKIENISVSIITHLRGV